MTMIAEPASVSKAARWSGLAMSGIVILFLLFDAGIKLVPLEIVTETSAQLGLPTDPAFARMNPFRTRSTVQPRAPKTALRYPARSCR